MENIELNRKPKGLWIPIEIWEDKNLNWNEKILFLEIDSFTSKDNDCFVSNEYISNLLGISETSANKILSSLIKKGYVIKTKFDGRRRFVKSALSFTTSQGCDLQQGCLELDNNILNINNNINTIKEDTNVSKKEKEIEIGFEVESKNEDYIKFRKWMKENCPFCDNPKHFDKSTITEKEFINLKNDFTGAEIAQVILGIENRKDLRRKYSSLYLTALNWLKNNRNK